MKFYTEGWEDYELIDAGGGKKLERWGNVITIRPELQAYFKSGKSFEEWNKLAHWEFTERKGKTGDWKRLKPNSPDQWVIGYKNLKFNLELTKFKHLGLFPEQRINWDEVSNKLKSGDKFLNLFAYTGAMSLVARNAGADTIHVDSVKQLITWASNNMEASRLLNIRWVHDDALKFLKRQVRKEAKFDVIVMDPPAWGIGAKKEKWKLEDKLDELIASAAATIADDGLIVLNTYSPQVDLKLIKELTSLYLSDRNNEIGELWMKTTTGKELFYGNLLRSGSQKDS
jgi:23S rRNA (cytosine1962-C5)-methyltransferase